MSVNYHVAAGPSAPLRLAPSPGFIWRPIGPRPVKMVLLRVRLLLETLKKAKHNRRPGNRPERPRREEPENYSESDSIWDDPALWMLMMH
jgi:hypothetical protein